MAEAGFLYTGQSRGEIRRDAKYITVDTDIERIPNWRLSTLESLVWLELPDELKVIGHNSFYCCFVLQRVIFPNSLTDIGNNAFEGCYELNPVVLPEGLQAIGIAAFRSCKSLIELEVPSTVTMIATSAFADCSSLQSVILPDLIEYVNSWFLRCGSLRHVSMSSKTTTIEPYSFSRCYRMLSLELPETISSIQEASFIDCVLLRNIFLPANVSRIGAMFPGCEDLLEVFEEDQLLDVLQHRFDGLPVHRICYFQKYSEEETVLKEIRQSLISEPFETFQDGLEMTPLHILALSCKPRLNLWIELQVRFPQCLNLRDKWGCRPINYLMENLTPDSLPLLSHCIQAGTSAALKSLRSAKWKITLLRLVEELSDKTNRQDQVVNINNTISVYLRMEAASLLEEALWKAQIAKVKQADSLALDSDSRLNCRITSGAEIVIPNVLFFVDKKEEKT
ncbi:MAG: hypothetical protein SGBAC_003611 [Bacillariaceae sp.]